MIDGGESHAIATSNAARAEMLCVTPSLGLEFYIHDCSVFSQRQFSVYETAFHYLPSIVAVKCGPVSHRTAQANRGAATPIDSKEFGASFDRVADARVVLIGDASHGTSELYRTQAAITKHLITNHGFNLVCIEGDWPDAYTIDEQVRAKAQSTQPFSLRDSKVFPHFPRWMWRYQEFQDFLT